jgi:hypothetical protein
MGSGPCVTGEREAASSRAKSLRWRSTRSQALHVEASSQVFDKLRCHALEIAAHYTIICSLSLFEIEESEESEENKEDSI